MRVKPCHEGYEELGCRTQERPLLRENRSFADRFGSVSFVYSFENQTRQVVPVSSLPAGATIPLPTSRFTAPNALLGI